ncbi:MAG: hypothetical protein UY28_C0038G0017 [Candidatus Amesbacteria bacterium GW2011_GWB1_48_13]|uniref:Uncharacterized protein n=1 Tax=Candidatus Amesbacteria bacterium GW2011_GWB1_48_13 TaxID=1618362 RepID=A0A0G1UPZ5_9BACT|nr:MAG: hypothetical protein UY28_C0038G0017 [Candidatus Amesbacteria bacterium GW2011_GWB1_48_13]
MVIRPEMQKGGESKREKRQVNSRSLAAGVQADVKCEGKN